MSFDPFQIAMLKRLAPGLTRGIIAQHSYADREWDCWSAGKKYVCANLLHGWHTRPHFVAYGIKDLPRVAPFITRNVFGLPLLTWTVRSAADRQRAERWTDQIIFEGFRA